MVIKHIELSQANTFIEVFHRHHKGVVGHRFSLGCYNNGKLVGVAVVGRPRARNIDQRSVVEVLRLCTDGTQNACSILYSACVRAAKALGYSKIITYILECENGASLKASNWQFEYITKGGSWNAPSRPRTDKAPTCRKKMFAVVLNKGETHGRQNKRFNCN